MHIGPRCPHCSRIYEWCLGEIEQEVYAPQLYFCPSCHGVFTLDPDEVRDLQEVIRVACEWCEELGEDEPDDGWDEWEEAPDDALGDVQARRFDRLEPGDREAPAETNRDSGEWELRLRAPGLDDEPLN